MDHRNIFRRCCLVRYNIVGRCGFMGRTVGRSQATDRRKLDTRLHLQRMVRRQEDRAVRVPPQGKHDAGSRRPLLHLLHEGRSPPKFASNNRLTGTARENRAVAQGCIAYFGSYTVQNEKDGVVMLTVEGSTFPNWDGQKQKRRMTVSGDTLQVINPASGIGGTSYIVWKRAR